MMLAVETPTATTNILLIGLPAPIPSPLKDVFFLAYVLVETIPPTESLGETIGLREQYSGVVGNGTPAG